MHRLTFLLLLITIRFCIYGQDVIFISNPSLEVKEDTQNPFPMGWHSIDKENYSPIIVRWKNEAKSPSEGQSYITLSNTDSTNQVISQLISNTPIQSFRTYQLEIDVSVMDENTETKLQVIGIGSSWEERQVLATSWTIEHTQWKKSSEDNTDYRCKCNSDPKHIQR